MPTPSPDTSPLVHTAFYRFVQLTAPDQIVAALRELLARPDASGLTGSIIIATEGINGMLAGSPSMIDWVEHALQHEAAFSGAFTGMTFKRSACITKPFGKLKIHLKKEIVPLGVEGVDARQTGIDVSPKDWRELIKAPDVVLLDNRNSFEFRLGHFEGAIDPQVVNFRDFPEYVRTHAATWKAQGKRVAMYCTGGIRCEKTSAWMKDMDMPVYQLEGGILNYFQQMPDAQHDWLGECFVFDNRVALDTHLQETDTTLEDVYQGEADGPWRLDRARRLADTD